MKLNELKPGQRFRIVESQSGDEYMLCSVTLQLAGLIAKGLRADRVGVIEVVLRMRDSQIDLFLASEEVELVEGMLGE